MILKNSEKKENGRLEFTVESDAAELEKALTAAYNKNKGQIAVPGFRKGKAPRAIIEGMYGKEVFHQDALDELAQPAFDKGIEEGKVDFIGMPGIMNAKVEEGVASFTFIVELYPEVELGQYKGVEVLKVDATVTDEDVDAEIENTRKRNARKISVEDRAAQLGDTANIDFEGFLDAEKTNAFDGGKGTGFDLELGSGSFVPGFEDQIVGMNIGDEKDINITFPENYTEELAGKDVVFAVKVNALTYSELPELDDEFVKDVSEFDTLDEYKANIRKDLEAKKADDAAARMRSAAINKACDNMKVTVPETMIRSHIDSIIRNYAAQYGLDDPKKPTSEIAKMLGIDEQTMNLGIRPNAETEAKVEILVKAVAAEEKIEASEEELNAYIEKVAGDVGAPAEDVKKYFGMEYITSQYVRDTVLNLVADSSVAVDSLPEEAKAEEAAEEKAE